MQITETFKQYKTSFIYHSVACSVSDCIPCGFLSCLCQSLLVYFINVLMKHNFKKQRHTFPSKLYIWKLEESSMSTNWNANILQSVVNDSIGAVENSNKKYNPISNCPQKFRIHLFSTCHRRPKTFRKYKVAVTSHSIKPLNISSPKLIWLSYQFVQAKFNQTQYACMLSF